LGDDSGAVLDVECAIATGADFDLVAGCNPLRTGAADSAVPLFPPATPIARDAPLLVSVLPF
jgi:hypothetical protein